jgi:hypothetical protein
MSVQLDTVLTVAIGDMTEHGPLSDAEWDAFGDLVRQLLSFEGTVVAETTGIGETSDQVDQVQERTRVFVTINVANIGRCRRDLANLLDIFGQSSACFAFDRDHEPCFATANGYRPERVDVLV